MEESILNTIKKMLGIQADYTPFDTDILVYINSAMMVLQQIGVGPENGFRVSGPNETWNGFLSDEKFYDGVKTYIYLSVKVLFDPPGNSFVMDAMKTLKEELEWRLREQAEFYPGDGTKKGYYQQIEAEKAASEDELPLPFDGLKEEVGSLSGEDDG